MKQLLSLFCGLLLISACSTSTVKTTEYVSIVQEKQALAEELLLDIGIGIFDPGVEELDEDSLEATLPEIREAESRFVPYMLMETLQSSGNWGVTRVLPDESPFIDVYVTGRLVRSDGENLALEATVYDVTGRHWFTRQYTHTTSKYSYEPAQQQQRDPFQTLYNKVCNDMLSFRQQLSAPELKAIRLVSELRFARSFQAQAFDRHLSMDEQGVYHVVHLPAEDDPILQRVRSIRERDYLFIDTLQEHYSSFYRQMSVPYKEWRKQSYGEVIALRELQRSARNRTIVGVAALVGGIAAAGSDSAAMRSAANVGTAGGGYLIKSGFDRRAESRIHLEALQELGDSLSAEVNPHVIELDDQTVTLSGSVQAQYKQWRDVLEQMYISEIGSIEES